jgi:hypothetical protein
MSLASATIVTSSEEFIAKVLENRGTAAVSHTGPSKS